ncbi:MAG: type II toxin-antitoxin system PemK/MazF family toxin [Ruminococcus flavefaciens]|nr:type II toxin-antitoxin system PemK/MazF family toxin [Ruminococcus flavefaciens]
MNIPFKKLAEYLKNNTSKSKTTKAYEGNIVTKSLLGIIAKLINKFENFTEYEIGLFIKSFDKWLDRKDIVNTPENSIIVQVGDICMIDWNINYNPELSYIHPCLIIEDINNMISVLPVSASHLDEAYHPEFNPTGNKFYRKVGISDGFKKECAIFLGELKVISKSRIINKIGSLSCDLRDENGLFREIRWSLQQIYFPYETSVFRNTIEEKENRIYALDKTRRRQQRRADKNWKIILQLENENENLKKELTKSKSTHIIKTDSKIG